MSGLLTPPRPHHENVADIADYAEIECLRRKDRSVSKLDIARIVQRAGDDDEILSEDDVNQSIIDAFADLENRVAHCGPPDGRYPFALNSTGTVLEFQSSKYPPELYLFLLLATQLNMNSERTQGRIDGTLLFEELCSYVASQYWGAPHASVGTRIFGTARFADRADDDSEVDRATFAGAIADLCNALQEGAEFDPKDDGPVRARDAKLDVVVWRRFADRRSGQLIGFGQCKTGTHWEGELTKLQPEAFCGTWLRRSPAHVPVRLFFLAARVFDRWEERSRLGGIIFDRCRIIEYSNGLPKDVLLRVRAWVKAALTSNGLEL